MKISVEEVIAYRNQIHEKAIALIQKKGHDYNRVQQNGGNTLFNVTVCELLDIASTEQGLLTRLSDKFMRIISLGTSDILPAVTDEPLEATVQDIHNYIDYLLIIRDKKREHLASQIISINMDKKQVNLRSGILIALPKCSRCHVYNARYLTMDKLPICFECVGVLGSNPENFVSGKAKLEEVKKEMMGVKHNHHTQVDRLACEECNR